MAGLFTAAMSLHCGPGTVNWGGEDFSLPSARAAASRQEEKRVDFFGSGQYKGRIVAVSCGLDFSGGMLLFKVF